MHRYRLYLTSISLLTLLTAGAQTSLPVPTNIATAISRGTRTVSGDPGPRYWQNSADYSIHVSFSPANRLVHGTEAIAYVNNSPDTIRQLIFKLYPNLYKKGVQRSQDIDPQDLTDGVTVSKVIIEGKPYSRKQSPGRRRRQVTEDTNMPMTIPALMPGATIHLSLEFTYILNKTSHIRTGQVDSGAFFIAYFFPRITVFDDVDQWNLFPYLGSQEFYNDFCNFSVAITVPRDYLVWATGNLVNAPDVLRPAFVQRLERAEKEDGITTIVDTADLRAGSVTQRSDSNTWKFEASNVTDFTFAISNHYIWKASSLVVDPSSGRRTRVDAVFNPSHRDYYEVIHYARKTVEAMSYQFPAWPYPYPHETVFDGLDQMEYPMMVNDNPLTDRPEDIYLTDHEIFHTMFPFYMGINETKYAFMDEGWATIGEWVISPMIDPALTDSDGVRAYSYLSGREDDLPIITPSTQETGNTYYLNSYPKPGLGYLYARDMLGDSLFLEGVHQYIRTWQGKHPLPLDFFASMNAGTHRNLDWFWSRWFYEGGYPDLAIAMVQKEDSGGWTATIENKGGKPVPVNLTVEYADGHTGKVHRSVEVWEKSSSVTVPLGQNGDIRKVTLGGPFDADQNPKDNVFKVK